MLYSGGFMPLEGASATHRDNEDVNVHFPRETHFQLPFLEEFDSNVILNWLRIHRNIADQLTKSLEDAIHV